MFIWKSLCMFLLTLQLAYFVILQLINLLKIRDSFILLLYLIIYLFNNDLLAKDLLFQVSYLLL